MYERLKHKVKAIYVQDEQANDTKIPRKSCLSCAAVGR